MRNTQWLLALGACVAVSSAAMAQPAYVTAAIADPARPAAEREQDPERKVTDVVVFAAVKPGEKVVDLMPGGGYYTRIWSKIVGPTGKVWAVNARPANDSMKALLADTAYSVNTAFVEGPLAQFKSPEPADVVFTSRNYHDLYNNGGSPTAATKAMFDTLKPGGRFVILDHRALPGVNSQSFHRIDPALVRKEVEAAGFQFVGESNVLARASDPKNVPVQDPSIRGETDQFILVFRKP
jgi:predicted methyltransferase